jgi:hypothetical protein
MHGIFAAKIIGTLHMIKTIKITDHYPRLLTTEEAEMLSKDMRDSSVWARAELKRRRAVKSVDPAIEEKG